jgi:hypothetical protein
LVRLALTHHVRHVATNSFPGGTFKVSVPVKESEEDEDDDKDHNKFSREFQELVCDYGAAYDDWCQAQRKADPKFPLAKTKDEKFDKIIDEFPNNLVTSIDREYMKKIMRRARQNKKKRARREAAAVKNEISNETKVKEEKQEESEVDEEEENDDDAGSVPSKAKASKGRKVNLPTMGTEFDIVTFDAEDFAQ